MTPKPDETVSHLTMSFAVKETADGQRYVSTGGTDVRIDGKKVGLISHLDVSARSDQTMVAIRVGFAEGLAEGSFGALNDETREGIEKSAEWFRQLANAEVHVADKE